MLCFAEKRRGDRRVERMARIAGGAHHQARFKGAMSRSSERNRSMFSPPTRRSRLRRATIRRSSRSGESRTASAAMHRQSVKAAGMFSSGFAETPEACVAGRTWALLRAGGISCSPTAWHVQRPGPYSTSRPTSIPVAAHRPVASYPDVASGIFPGSCRRARLA